MDATTARTITILVTKANKAGQPFVGPTLVFAVDSSTQVELKGGAIDHGTLQVKGDPSLDLAGLQLLIPKLLVEQT